MTIDAWAPEQHPRGTAGRFEMKANSDPEETLTPVGNPLDEALRNGLEMGDTPEDWMDALATQLDGETWPGEIGYEIREALGSPRTYGDETVWASRTTTWLTDSLQRLESAFDEARARALEDARSGKAPDPGALLDTYMNAYEGEQTS